MTERISDFRHLFPYMLLKKRKSLSAPTRLFIQTRPSLLATRYIARPIQHSTYSSSSIRRPPSSTQPRLIGHPISHRALNSMTVPATAAAPSVEQPIDVLLIGLGSIGSIYAYLLERVGRIYCLGIDGCALSRGAGNRRTIVYGALS